MQKQFEASYVFFVFHNHTGVAVQQVKLALVTLAPHVEVLDPAPVALPPNQLPANKQVKQEDGTSATHTGYSLEFLPLSFWLAQYQPSWVSEEKTHQAMISLSVTLTVCFK